MITGKNILLLAGGVLGLALLAVTSYLLFGGISEFTRTGESLQNAKKELDRYYNLDPFPSPANVAVEQKNVEEQREWFSRLTGALRKSDISSQEKSPSIFVGQLGARREQLRRMAAESGLAPLPADFAFGFERYYAAGSGLPAPDDVPRLTEQLLIVERICRVLFEQKISGLASVAREEFESGAPGQGPRQARPRQGSMFRPVRPVEGAAEAPAAPRPGDAGVMGKDALFAKYHFVVDFSAKEAVLWQVLNRLAASEMFIVVTGVWIEKNKDDVRPAPARPEAEAPEAAPAGRTAPKAGDKAPEAVTYRRERLVSGPQIEDPMSVRLELDVYKFAETR